MMKSERWLAVLAIGAAMLVAPAAAPAATTCDYATQVLQVDLGADADFGGLEVAAGGEIVVRGGAGQVACTGGPPTVTNTNAISVFNHPGSSNNNVAIEGAGSFAPGATPEPGDDEIEIFVLLNDGPNSSLRVRTGPLGGNLRFGTSGINTNASPAEDTPDADIFPTGVPELVGYGAVGPGSDTLGAQGGAGTGNALTTGIVLFGGNDADSVTGGQGNDALGGDDGDDIILGMGGDDILLPSDGNDTVNGGPGTDVADYIDNLSGIGVVVDLALAGPQNTIGSGTETLTGVENLSGGVEGDTLRGDGGPNRLDGSGGGEDTLLGRGGVDTLLGRDGADSLDVRDGGLDNADCGTETDRVTADKPGTDTLTACENVFFAVTAPPPAGTSGRDVTPARVTGYRLSRSRFVVGRRRRAGTTVRFRLSEAATMSFTVERLVRRRYRKLKGTLKRRGRRGTNSFKFTGSWRKRKLKPGRYRLVATATDSARNRSKPKRVRFRVVR